MIRRLTVRAIVSALWPFYRARAIVDAAPYGAADRAAAMRRHPSSGCGCLPYDREGADVVALAEKLTRDAANGGAR